MQNLVKAQEWGRLEWTELGGIGELGQGEEGDRRLRVERMDYQEVEGSKRNPPVQPLIRAVRYAQHHKHKKRSFPTAKQNFKSQPQEKGAP